ncbi:hypothetical protein EVAR_35921_1 [Eumeta japonica]|uniref:Uncharacterized protein n=1 Tax=Eumeta variegata TaxID=151549 RepID=A0A4C1W665_EUMVA|nr:hypothetical protein EVAR_35921_1 [Eumeta japonica]
MFLETSILLVFGDKGKVGKGRSRKSYADHIGEHPVSLGERTVQSWLRLYSARMYRRPRKAEVPDCRVDFVVGNTCSKNPGPSTATRGDKPEGLPLNERTIYIRPAGTLRTGRDLVRRANSSARLAGKLYFPFVSSI